MKFIVDGDVHFSADGIRQDKQEHWNDFLDSLKIKSKRPDFILLVGDLSNPDTGIFCYWELNGVKGLHKNYSAE